MFGFEPLCDGMAFGLALACTVLVFYGLECLWWLTKNGDGTHPLF